MASFSDDRSDSPRIDLHLLENGAVTLYFKRSLLDPDAVWLREHAYDVKEFDCLGWTDVKDMHRALAETLSLPDYYGMNLDALNDCLSEVDFPQGGLVLVFLRFDAFASRHRAAAQALLDVLAYNARRFLLFGHRLLVLVQSDDPGITFDPVGATPVRWNAKEWRDEDRGV